MVQTRVGGRRGTAEPRIPPCPGFLSAVSEMVTEGQAIQTPDITSYVLNP